MSGARVRAWRNNYVSNGKGVGNANRTHMIMTWLARYVATLIFVSHVGKDGQTAYRWSKGKTMRRPFCRF